MNDEVLVVKNVLVIMKEEICFPGSKFFMTGSQQKVAKCAYYPPPCLFFCPSVFM